MSIERLRRARRQAGVTLVELIIAMVIIGVAVAGLVAAFNTTSKNSADPLVNKQMAAIAESLMDEITLKPFAVAVDATTGNGRDNFTDVRDFNGYGRDAGGNLIVGIRDVSGNPIATLSQFSVEVSVQSVTLTGMPAGAALQITVTVTNTSGARYVLTGWRTNYA